MSDAVSSRPLQPLLVASVVFVLAATVAASIIWRLEQYRLRQLRSQVADTTEDHARQLKSHIDRALSAAYALAALVREGNGRLANFDAVGRQLLPYFPGVSSVSLAPGGVIRSVVPLAGNEKAIGQDLLSNPATKREASLALQSRALTLAGPFVLVQGETAAIGRLPVFLDEAGGIASFWGFVNVVIRFPDALESAGLPQLRHQGYAYRLWRSDPDSRREQTIAASGKGELLAPVESELQVPNGTWTLSVTPEKGWNDPLGLSLDIARGLLFSLLLAYLAKLLMDLRLHRRGLELQVAARTADLKAREDDLERAQQIAHVGSWVLDLVTKQLQLSEECRRIYGLSRDAPATHETLLERVHVDDREAATRAWSVALRGGRYDVEHRVSSGGAIRWVHEQADPEFAPAGSARRSIGTVQDITERKLADDKIRHYVAQLQGAFMRTVEVATTLGEMRDPYTAGHERRVAEIAVAIGAELGLDAHHLEGLRVAGYLHDIGKINVPSEILAKPGRLSAIEFQLIQQHPQSGYDVLKGVGFPWPVAEATLQHHERLDGSGYPNGLAGEAIVLEARVLAVADTVEAMASHRPYRPGRGIDMALTEIERGRGSAYDPAVADACLKLFREKDFRIPD